MPDDHAYGDGDGDEEEGGEDAGVGDDEGDGLRGVYPDLGVEPHVEGNPSKRQHRREGRHHDAVGRSRP